MDSYITRPEHEEYVRRMDEEHKRQNHRISELESGLKEATALTLSVQKLAINMESMIEEQKAQGKRIGDLESRDGQMWRKVTSYMITAVAGIIIGYILRQLGIF